jgi:hypothetical protein
VSINAEPGQDGGVALGVNGGFGKQNRLAALFIVMGSLKQGS